MRISAPPPSRRALTESAATDTPAAALRIERAKSEAFASVGRYASCVAPGENWAFSPTPNLIGKPYRDYLRDTACWETPYDRLDTRMLHFTMTNGNRMAVPTMMKNGAHMPVSEALSGFAPLVIQQLHHHGKYFDPDPTSGLCVLHAMPVGTQSMSAAADALLAALSTPGRLREVLDFQACTVDFCVPRLMLNVESDAADLNFVLRLNEDGIRGRAPEYEASVVKGWQPPDHTIHLDRPFFTALLTPEGIPLVVAYHAVP